MSLTLIYTVVVLVSIGVVAAVVLFYVAKKFYVEEDPRIDDVEEVLPAANCGGCGFAGCRAFAEACVKADDLSAVYCPVGGADCMSQVASILGKEVAARAPKVAVLRCNGTCANRPSTSKYDGAVSCSIASSTFAGETGCSYGCVGCGDCVDVCDFGALSMDPETGLPVVDDEKCVACNACVTECPKNLFELRKKMPKDRKVFVSCRNNDKGGAAKKACSAACIGCSKCAKECPFEAIEVSNFLAFIDSDKCKLCRKCVAVCPTNAIVEANFPPRKVKPVAKPVAKPAADTAMKSVAKPVAKATEESGKDNVKPENKDPQ